MAMLEFVDSNGVTWRIWNTVPSVRTSLSGEFERGWLTFESTAGLRRLAPVPPNWEAATPDRLELMCRAASEVPRRTRPISDSETDAGPQRPS
jgi:DNA/RNA-binding domain of Phe-tRNA-synthetase-like protein